LRKRPLLRAVRVDKYAAIALSATLLQYLKGQVNELPIHRMMEETLERLGDRATKVVALLNQDGIESFVIDGQSMPGGGSLPDETLPTKLIAIAVTGPLEDFSRRLRLGSPPVLGRSLEGCFVFDLRTVFPEQDAGLLAAIVAAYGA